MAMRYHVLARNAGINARIAAVGPSPILKLYSTVQSKPPNRMAASEAGELVTIQLPDTWMTKADGGAAFKVGNWRGTATGNGRAKSFRIFEKSGKTCFMEGAIPGEMTLEDDNIAVDHGVTVEAFALRSGNR